MLRSTAHDRSFVSLRSPLPLLAAGVGVALLVIAVVTLPSRPSGPDPSQVATLTDQEALTIVAESMRSAESASRVSAQGSARFEDGTWLVSVGDAQFHFTQRNRIVVPDNQAATQLKYAS